jgi:hypothetical protein
MSGIQVWRVLDQGLGVVVEQGSGCAGRGVPVTSAGRLRRRGELHFRRLAGTSRASSLTWRSNGSQWSGDRRRSADSSLIRQPAEPRLLAFCSEPEMQALCLRRLNFEIRRFSRVVAAARILTVDPTPSASNCCIQVRKKIPEPSCRSSRCQTGRTLPVIQQFSAAVLT